MRWLSELGNLPRDLTEPDPGSHKVRGENRSPGLPLTSACVLQMHHDAQVPALYTDTLKEIKMRDEHGP